MDPDASDAEADEQAMAQALGFSSFGAQDRPQKKRKYNPNADATVVPGTGQVEEFSTGSNSTPLGAAQGAVGSNADELDLGEDAEDGQVPVPAHASGVSDAQVRSGTLQPSPAGLPQRPAPSAGATGPSAHGSQRQDRQGGRAGHGGPGRDTWYEGYYDHASNSNPWDRLEKSMGLQSKGTWIPHDFTRPTAP